MTNQTPDVVQDQEPFIPPYYMLILALVGFLVAGGVALTQSTFNVVGWGALGIAILSIIMWIFMAPDQAKALITGRSTRYGGVSIIVTVIFLIMLIIVYLVVRDLNLRVDLTQSDNFSLTDEVRQAITGLGADPNLPSIKILAFLGAAQASTRDQGTLLLEDYVETSGGKISYEFVDPDRNPVEVTKYNVRAGQVVVVRLDEQGQPDVANAETVNSLNQDELTNAVLRVAASGDFRAYFINVDGGLQLDDATGAGLSSLNSLLTDTLDWKTQQVSLFELTGTGSEIKLNDEAADAEVMVIAGGDKALSDDELKVITDFVDKGGSLVIFAAPSVTAATNAQGESSVASNKPLALADNLSNYLYTNFGMRFVDNLVLDPASSVQSPAIPVATNFSSTSYITRNFVPNANGVVFDLPHSIELAPTLPENVTVDELVKTGDTSFAKTDIQAVLDGNMDQADTDPKGPFTLAASAENSVTGARVVLFGSSGVPSDTFATFGSGIVNREIGFNTMVWATRFNDFFSTVTVQSAVRPQDAAIFANDQVLRNINLFTIFVLPFGVLAIGFLVWWNTRERAPETNPRSQEN
jgi:ABC-type uncharacterized transport system involved in gliding motility auxiliary subunit